MVGRPGDTITLPYFKYIGDAQIVPEGQDIPIQPLMAETVQATVRKVGIGVQMTDEAVLSGHGQPINQAIAQLALSIASKVDDDILSILDGIGEDMTHVSQYTQPTNFFFREIAEALLKFGEDIDGPKVLLCSPEVYGQIRQTDFWIVGTEIGAQLLIRGAVGMIHGCQVIISNKLSKPERAFIVKPEALALFMKRDVLIENQRNIINKSTIMTADKHYVGYLYDESKAIKILPHTVPDDDDKAETELNEPTVHTLGERGSEPEQVAQRQTKKKK